MYLPDAHKRVEAATPAAAENINDAGRRRRGEAGNTVSLSDLF
jgi:hypothetical protein